VEGHDKKNLFRRFDPNVSLHFQIRSSATALDQNRRISYLKFRRRYDADVADIHNTGIRLYRLLDAKKCLQENSATNQLVVSQVADWITRGLVNSPTAN